MRPYLVSLLLVLCATTFGQEEHGGQLEKLLKDVLQDSAMGADIAKINGLPARMHYTFQKEENKEIVLNAQLLQKEYYPENNSLPPAAISKYKYQVKKYQKVARFRIILPDGTMADIRAVQFSPNQAWHPVFYHLRGRDMETGKKVRIMRIEV